MLQTCKSHTFLADGLPVSKMPNSFFLLHSGGAVYRFNMDGGEKQKFYEDQGAFSGIALCHK